MRADQKALIVNSKTCSARDISCLVEGLINERGFLPSEFHLAPIDIETFVEIELGITVRYQEKSISGTHIFDGDRIGFTAFENERPVIYLHPNLLVTAQRNSDSPRFLLRLSPATRNRLWRHTMAHETAHILLHSEILLELASGKSSVSDEVEARMETEANVAADALLMPSQRALPIIRSIGEAETRICSAFDVLIKPAQRRIAFLRQMELLDEDERPLHLPPPVLESEFLASANDNSR